MLYFLYQNEPNGRGWCFVDFEQLTQDEIAAIVDIANTHRYGDNMWQIGGYFRSGNVVTCSWKDLLCIKDCFLYEKEFQSGQLNYFGIKPVKPLRRLSEEILHTLAQRFRKSFKIDLPSSEEDTLFIPLFEKYVETQQ